MTIPLFLLITIIIGPGFFTSFVPFVPQAPFGNWQDQRQQDGCEETASLMAVMWARNRIITKTQGLEYIINISEYQIREYSYFTDTSAVDTLDRIIKGYFNYKKAFVTSISSVSDLITLLQSGNVLIIPTNGRLLGNPHFSGLGPERHNLLVKSYDSKTGEFITNDPGTQFGENYRYSKDTLFSAIRDYPSGRHLPILNNQKNVIVISK